MSDYTNIIKALGGGQTPLDKQAENLRAFDELNRQGIAIPDLLRRLDTLEAKVKDMGERSQDAELFAVMESAVSDDPEVTGARAHRERMMETVLTEACMKDPRFAEADKSYRTAVNAAYVRMKQP